MSTVAEFRWPQARHVASTLRQPFFRICPSVIRGMGFEDQPIVLSIAELKLDQVSKCSIAIRRGLGLRQGQPALHLGEAGLVRA